jgi:predicted RNase H-like HicB family nuclease
MSGARNSLLVTLVATASVVTLALGWFGWRNLEQESALDRQRARERLESGADAMAAGIRGKLAESGERLSGWISSPASPAPSADGAGVFTAGAGKGRDGARRLPSVTGRACLRHAWREPRDRALVFPIAHPMAGRVLRTPCVTSYSERGGRVTRTYTGTYTKIPSGYMGQLVDWPEVVTEGKTLEECREMLSDALREMIAAYRQQQKELPAGRALLEQIPVEV